MYHDPVLLEESLDWLNIQPDGIYVDVTFGGGGHARAILERLGPKGRLIGFDQDADAKSNELQDERFTLIPHNFRYLQKMLRLEGVKEVDGLLADLGVSSHQFDVPERGFSFRFDAPLDMRMNQDQEKDAQRLLREINAKELQDILSTYGELRNARTLARAIVKAGEVKPIETVGELLAIADPLVRGKRHRYLSQLFQALRIAVNEELLALEEMLTQSAEVLAPGGRLVCIAYHSLEDRMVKQFMRYGQCKGQPEKDLYGHFYKPFDILTRKAEVPSAEEIKSNSRARSAKLRAAERRARDRT